MLKRYTRVVLGFADSKQTPCHGRLFKNQANKLNVERSETKMTASVLKQDPNT